MASERALKEKKSWWPLRVDSGDEPIGTEPPEARIRINRPTRIAFDPIRGAKVKLASGNGEHRKHEVTNLSTHGLGMICADLGDKAAPGSEFSGELEFGTHRFAITFRVVHITRSGAGCIFVHRNELYIQAFIKWFSAEIAAAKLRRMNQLILKEEPDGKPIYYFGDGNELFIVEEAKPQEGAKPKLLRFHAMILGNYFETESNRDLKYGHAFIDSRDGDAMSYKGSELIRYSSEMPREMVDLFGRFIESIGDLEPWHKAALRSILNVG
jgi:hypothetical protein